MKKRDRIKRDKRIMDYRARYPEKTLEEIAERFKLSIPRITQIIQREKKVNAGIRIK